MEFIEELEVKEIPTPEYEYVTKKSRAVEVLSYLDNFDTFEVDTEGTALDPYQCKTTLIQIGIPGDVYVFDIRGDTEYSNFDGNLFKDFMEDKSKLKLLQNANYDIKVLKVQFGYYIENIYDTMIAEQLLFLGVKMRGFALVNLVDKYLHMKMDKEPRGTFEEYNQEFTQKQLDYAAKDVIILDLIRSMQMERVKRYELGEVLQLENDFIKPLSEMELNGIKLDVDKWKIIMKEVKFGADKLKVQIESGLESTQEQTALFGVSTININSPSQLLKSLRKLGIPAESTDVKELEKFAGHQLIDEIIEYRGLNKLITTYAEPLVERINKKTGRLHTRFKQMVQTGRLSSTNPNLQNIPGKQKYRSCFIAEEGKSLVTVDQSSAELLIMGNMSMEPTFLEAFKSGKDLHTLNASRVFEVPYEKVTKEQRTASKAITFGLCYGISAVGLARRLKISKQKAQQLMDKYYKVNNVLKKWLDKSSKDAIKTGYSDTVIKRKRFYSIPPVGDPAREKVKGSVERQARNARIQGSIVADTYIKGVGFIGDQVGKVVNLETGFGEDSSLGTYSGIKDVFDLITTNGTSLKITEDHLIPIATKDGIIDTPVKALVKSDCIMVDLSSTEGEVTDISGYIYTKGHWRETFKDFDLPTVMTEDLAFIVGCLIGDGCYSAHNTVRFCCPETEVELLEKYNNSINRSFGYSPKIKKYTKGRNISLHTSNIYSVVIRGFLKHIGLDHVIHDKKTIPKCFFTETQENIGSILNGLFSTDGHMTKTSGPCYTTTSKKLAEDIQLLLLNLGINSNLLTYPSDKNKDVYKVAIPKRFNQIFKDMIGFSTTKKAERLGNNLNYPKWGGTSVVPDFIPTLIFNSIYNSEIFKTLSHNEKHHLHRFKLGSCSYNSWRKFYEYMPECRDKQYLKQFLNKDFCKLKSLTYLGKEKTYDLICNNIHYFIANGLVVHNSDADTIKKAMILCMDRLAESKYSNTARLILTVHDEIIVECDKEDRYEVAEIVVKSVEDGFNGYFPMMPMKTEPVFGPTWLKGECGNEVGGVECGNNEMELVEDDHYGTKLICSKCGHFQG